MVVILDAVRAELLARQAVEKCSRSMVATTVILPGGKTLASRHSAKMGRLLQVRELCIMAVQGERVDITKTPEAWAKGQGEAMAPAPTLTGAALRIYSATGVKDSPNYQLVGVIGLIGVSSRRAVQVLRDVITSNGFLLTSDLPRGGAQA